MADILFNTFINLGLFVHFLKMAIASFNNNGEKTRRRLLAKYSFNLGGCKVWFLKEIELRGAKLNNISFKGEMSKVLKEITECSALEKWILWRGRMWNNGAFRFATKSESNT